MSDNFGAKPARVKTIFNHSKLCTLSAPHPTKKGIYCKLKAGLWENNPRFEMDSNDPDLKNPEAREYGRVTAALDPLSFQVVLDDIQAAVESQGPYKETLELYHHPKVDGQRSKDAVHQSNIWVGKDAEGHVFISVVSTDRKYPVVKFVFGPSDNRYTKLIKGDGTPLTRAEISIAYAKAFYKLLTGVMANALVHHYVDTQANGGGGGWKGGQGGGGGGYKQGGYKGNSGGGGGYKNNNGGGYNNDRQAGGGGASAEPKADGLDDYEDAIPF